MKWEIDRSLVRVRTGVGLGAHFFLRPLNFGHLAKEEGVKRVVVGAGEAGGVTEGERTEKRALVPSQPF